MDLIGQEESSSDSTSNSSSGSINNENGQKQQFQGTNSAAAAAADAPVVEDGNNNNNQGMFSEVETAVEIDGGRTSKDPTPCNTDTTTATAGAGGAKKSALSSGGGSSMSSTIYGRPLPVRDSGGSFPNAGSVLGPYFCLGQLGKGTFSSIHKCINMQYYHYYDRNRRNGGDPLPPPQIATNASSQNQLELSAGAVAKPSAVVVDTVSAAAAAVIANNNSRRRRVAAAKVELGSFQQSGVLESEATILDFLHRHVVPVGTVPVYMGHFRSERSAALLMEFLPGADMHQLRERIMAATAAQHQRQQSTAISHNDSNNNNSDSHHHHQQQQQQQTRRISTKDAIYFTADVMLPMLQSMHQVGVVHRDVKPSNCVRKGDDGMDFCIVDFGLSRSFIVPENSEFADKEHPWDEGKEWLKPLNYRGRKGCIRKERKQADFRGTSMYASLRVHQEKDYCPRDDVWSLLYVFCDLVSGGLPWMSLAANRDRAACQKVKEWVHGESGDSTDHTADLLKGDAYHVAKYRRERQKEAKVDAAKLSPVPEPLALSKDEAKVCKLREAFQHVAQLQFWDTPDYSLIQNCIRSFAEDVNVMDLIIAPMEWSREKKKSSISPEHQKQGRGSSVPEWNLADDVDPLEDGIFDEAEQAAKAHVRPDNFWSRLPVERRYQLAQMDYNLVAAKADGSVPPHRALRDWMKVVLTLLHEEWDSRKYEDGGHRTSTDGYKRTRYLELLKKCEEYAEEFENFQTRACFYDSGSDGNTLLRGNGGGEDSVADGVAESSEARQAVNKRRKVIVQHGSESSTASDFVFVSRALFGLRLAIKAEMAKKAPPPVRISFG